MWHARQQKGSLNIVTVDGSFSLHALIKFNGQNVLLFNLTIFYPLLRPYIFLFKIICLISYFLPLFISFFFAFFFTLSSFY
jgi:hypothetical protein